MIERGGADGSYVLCFDGRRIPFNIAYRKRKKLAISVTPDMHLEVAAPVGSPLKQILERVEKRAAWIMRHWRYFEQFHPAPPEPRYISGETHMYFGRQYRLKVHSGTGEAVKLIGKFLHVWAIDAEDRSDIRRLVEKWYRDHAQRAFKTRLLVCLEQCRSLKIRQEPRVAVRRMVRRWGSCTKSGNVLLNLNLVKVPVQCVDYVITHELCHLQDHSHGPTFYRLLSRCMPDWERRKARLNNLVI